MADIINLRTVRKQKARKDKDAQAADNRLKFGRSKAEKKMRKAEQNLASRQLDGHKLEDQ